MKIAYLTGNYPRATDTFIQREVKGLRARGFDVRTYSIRQPGVDHEVSEEVAEEKRNTTYILPLAPLRLLFSCFWGVVRTPRAFVGSLYLALRTARPGWRGAIYQLFYFLEAVALAGDLRKSKIAHLHNHFGDASGTVAMLAAKLAGIRYSVTFHGPHIFFDPTHWALPEKVKHANFVVCISHFCRSQMMLFANSEDWRKMDIVHCGVHPFKYSPTRVNKTAKKLVYTGRLAPEKGLPVLFESLKMLLNAGYDCTLILLGDGPEKVDLELLAQRLGIDKNVRFMGFASQPQVAASLGESDMFVLPSFAEGVPVSLMEAMASGVPVIATYVGGVSELVEHGVSGLLVYPGDPLSLTNAIAAYLDDPDLRAKVSRLGREKIVREFNIDVELDKLANLFRKPINEGCRP